MHTSTSFLNRGFYKNIRSVCNVVISISEECAKGVHAVSSFGGLTGTKDPGGLHKCMRALAHTRTHTHTHTHTHNTRTHTHTQVPGASTIQVVSTVVLT